MDITTPGVSPLRPKRVMKYYRFELRPEDMALLEQLPAEQRDALLSSGSYQERAQALNIPIGTVRSRLHRARAALEALRNGEPATDGGATPLN